MRRTLTTLAVLAGGFALGWLVAGPVLLGHPFWAAGVALACIGLLAAIDIALRAWLD